MGASSRAVGTGSGACPDAIDEHRQRSGGPAGAHDEGPPRGGPSSIWWAVLRTREGLKWCGSRLAAEGPYPLATSGYPLGTDGAVWIHPLTNGFYFSV